MARELHPELFGEEILAHTTRDLVIDPLEEVKRKVRSLDTQMQSVLKKVDQLSIALVEKDTDFQKKIMLIQSELSTTLKGFQIQQSTFTDRIQNLELHESQIKDLVDRHNILVQQFEQRMQNLQKVTSEQEYKLFTYKDTLSEILREIKNITANQ